MKDEITRFIKNAYGFEGFLEELPGYDDINYLIKCSGGEKYVIKIHDGEYTKPLIEVQSEILGYIHAGTDILVPEVIKDIQGRPVLPFIDTRGRVHPVSVLRFIEGRFLSDIPPTAELLTQVGKTLAGTDNRLENYRNPIIEARQYIWDLQYFPRIAENISKIYDPAKRKLISYFILQYRETAENYLHSVRKGIIHNDANDRNILVTENGNIALIDFGDMAYTHTINELAIAAAYVAMRDPDPLEIISPLINGYHSVRPVTDEEILVLYYLMAARLCISVVMSAGARETDPGNQYACIHEEAAWDLLEKWISINPVKAERRFMEATERKTGPVPVSEDYLTHRNKYISKALSVSYKKPLIMKSAAFQFMHDAEGKTYLDCVNNIMHVGHCHPDIVSAAVRQMSRMNTNTRYLYDALNQYAGELLARFPTRLSRIFFVSSGSAASDLAVRLARNATGRKDLIVMEHGYHGHTASGIEISHYKFSGKGGKGPEPWIHVAPIPDVYRGAWGADKANSGQLYANLTDPYFKNDIAAFISEPVVGCGGQIFMPDNYLPEVYRKTRDHGGVCIADEVQTGFGRTGRTFWAFELYNVIPDIIILGKSMGNGHPIGAVVCTEDISEAFENGMEFFSSFGGNPVSCEIGRSVLQVIENEGLQLNAEEVGKYIMNGLYTLKTTYPPIGDIRGSGLFIGIEMVKDPGTKTPSPELAGKIINVMCDKGFLLSTDGPYHNVIKIKPPMCITIRDARRLLESLDETMKYLQQTHHNLRK